MNNVPEVDRWISAEFARLAEIIQDYDENLELRWISPERRQTLDERSKPYCIWDTRPTQENPHGYPVIFASELDNPRDILERLFNIDNRNGNVLKKMEAHNAAVQAFRMKEHMDKQEEVNDFAAFAITTTLSKWKHNGIWYDDNMRRLDGHR